MAVYHKTIIWTFKVQHHLLAHFRTNYFICFSNQDLIFKIKFSNISKTSLPPCRILKRMILLNKCRTITNYLYLWWRFSLCVRAGHRGNHPGDRAVTFPDSVRGPPLASSSSSEVGNSHCLFRERGGQKKTQCFQRVASIGGKGSKDRREAAMESKTFRTLIEGHWCFHKRSFLFNFFRLCLNHQSHPFLRLHCSVAAPSV